jgi:tRNA/rRNA methyltransferase
MSLNVVLVRTEISGNIGTSARALANMGANRLILIDPRCAIEDEARMMAAGAQFMLERTVVYQSWDSFYAHEGDGLRIAFSRRCGRKRKAFTFDEILPRINPEENLYLVFGPEKNGLDANDLAFVNFTCHLPVFGDFSSLNLGQAVLLALFMVRQKCSPEPGPGPNLRGRAVKPFYFPDHLIKQWLEAMGFDIKARRASAYLTLRRLFLQNQPTRHEIQVLESILNQNIRKLKSVRFTTEELADDLGDVAMEEI